MEDYIDNHLLNKNTYNNNDFTILLALNKKNLIIDAIIYNKIENNFFLETYLFIVLLDNLKFDTIITFIKTNKVKNIEECFNIFMDMLSSNYNLIHIYNAFISNNIVPNKNHLNLAIEKANIEMVILLIDKYNFSLTSDQLERILEGNIGNNNIETILHNMKLDETVLHLICKYGNYHNICHVLNNKMIPSQKDYNNLFINKKIHGEELLKTIDMFINLGYKLKHEDIILATKNKIILHDSEFTKQFNPTKEFYALCNYLFKPIYNDTIKNNIDNECKNNRERESYMNKISKLQQKAENIKKLKGYMLFAQQKRKEIQEENPGLKIIEISKILGEKWRNLSDDEKKKYK